MSSFAEHGTSMIIYAFCFLLAIVMAVLAQVFPQKSRSDRLAPSVIQSIRPNRIFWMLSMMVLVLLASLRWQVGTDYPTYIYLYELFAGIDSVAMFFTQVLRIEPSFIILNILVRIIFDNFLLVFAFSSLLTMFFFYRAIEDYHEQSSVVLMVIVFTCLFFGTTLNIVRQMIAVAIVFYATRFVFACNYKKAAIWLIVALSFHYSALVILPFWFLRGKKRWQKNTRIILFSMLSLIVIGALVFPSSFAQLSLFSFIAQSAGEGAKLRFGLLLLRLPILIPVIVFRKRLLEHDERNYYWIILIIFEIVFSHFGYINDVFNRIALYFAVSWIVLLPALVRSMPTRNAQYRMGVYVLIIVVGLFIYFTAEKNYGDVLPYKSIFDAYLLGML